MLALLDESGGDCQTGGPETILSGDVDHVLRSELQRSSSCGTKRPVSSDVDVETLGRSPWESVMFDIQSGTMTRESSSRKFFGMSFVAQSVPSTSQFIETDNGTSEWESIARKMADWPFGVKVCVGNADKYSLYSRTEIQLVLVFVGQSITRANLPVPCWNIVFLGICLLTLMGTNKLLE